jgi:hypothetical protein
MDNPLQTFLDKYFAFLVVIGGAVVLVRNFSGIAQGTGTLTQGAGTFINAIAGGGAIGG